MMDVFQVQQFVSQFIVFRGLIGVFLERLERQDLPFEHFGTRVFSRI